jgi:hypothetical protein
MCRRPAARAKLSSSEATAWLTAVLRCLDDKDVDAYTAFMADDVEVSFNNGDLSMRGRDAVREGLAGFWQSFGTLEHDELNIYGSDHKPRPRGPQPLHHPRRPQRHHPRRRVDRPQRGR